jgi:Utp25, U3 small nucleolar RNA-associated SSU processome protein 25
VNLSLRDQGLVRPKILMLVPFRESARRIVEIMIKLLFRLVRDKASKTLLDNICLKTRSANVTKNRI